MEKKKSCGNCINCEKYGDKKERWTCENVAGSEGWPCDCSPPHDDACKNWGDNPADKDKAQDALRYFVDHFWDDRDQGGEIMEREKFMKEARLAAHKILEGKENGIMNLVQQAWAEGKRNAEVETFRAAIDEALDKRKPKVEPAEDAVYPTYGEWFVEHGDLVDNWQNATNTAWIANTAWSIFTKHIPADIAQELGIEPKEG